MESNFKETESTSDTKAMSGQVLYKTISAHNDDLYEQDGWAFKHLVELGKQGWEVIKIQPMHDNGSWVFLKNFHQHIIQS